MSSFTPQQLEATPAIASALAERNAQVAGVIDDVRSTTEREVLACARVLSDIVENTRRLTDESGKSLKLAMDRFEETNERFVQGMQEDIQGQTAAVDGVLDLARGIDAAISSINDLTMSSRLLAINARIEAARLGAQGSGFAVIADNLNNLSKVIRDVSDKVSTAIESVRRGLDPVREHADSMRSRTQSFIHEVGEQVKLASLNKGDGEGHDRLSAVTELSYQALSHLQFQDPVSQRLQSINAGLGCTAKRVERLLRGEKDVEEPEVTHFASGEDQLVTGEIMLF